MSKCEETAGFLISAPCRVQASHRCQACGKSICETHSRDASPRAGRNCIGCHRKFGARYDSATDDPYLFAGFLFPAYYQSYAYGSESWDEGRAAFREASEANEGDEDWESDFDGS